MKVEEDRQRGMKERKDGEECGQVEHNPLEQEARMCSHSPKTRGGEANTCIKNETMSHFRIQI